MPEEETLFCEYNLSRVLERQRQKMVEAINGHDERLLLTGKADELATHLEQEYWVQAPTINEDAINIERSEVQVDVSGDFRRAIARRGGPAYVPGVRLTVHVPFEGDKLLLRCRPRRFTLSPPRAAIRESELLFSFTRPHDDHEAGRIKAQLERSLGEIRSYLQCIAEEVSELNGSLRRHAKARIDNRLGRLAKDQELVASLGYPTRPPAEEERADVAGGADAEPRATGDGGSGTAPLPVPSPSELDGICRCGEDQTHEFKRPGCEVRKLTKEVAGMVNTRGGGMILYGVDDDGTQCGSDRSRQDFDQWLMNSVRNTIAPAASITIEAVDARGKQVIVVIVPPWDRRHVYYYEERVYIRRGTNVFAARPEEIRKLHDGEYVT